MDKDSAAIRLKTYLAACDLVEIAKRDLDITQHNSCLGDEDVKEICKWVGMKSPDTVQEDDGQSILGPLGINAMLYLSLNAFPWFYEKYELAQCN